MKNKLYKSLELAIEQLDLDHAGVYQLVNLTNNKTYVGSSANLDRRLREYLNPLYIKRNLIKGESYILKALLKYGYTNFGLRVLLFFLFYSKKKLKK